MRIGVIGGGAAGLTAAWLLEEQHDVVLFERDDRLGGHAHTIDVVVEGRTLPIDAGFQFFGTGPAYTTFNRLLDALSVKRRAYDATMSFTRGSRTLALPPWRGGWPVWGSLSPSSLVDLVQLRRFLSGVGAFVASRDTTITIAQYLERRRMPRAFVDDFLLPFLLAFWCVEPEELLDFAAYNVLYYLAQSLSGGMRAPRQAEVVGGMAAYIEALERSLRGTEVRLGVGVSGVRRGSRGLIVETSAGDAEFDQIVLATSAEQAALVTEGLGIPVHEQLSRFEYFDTEIAVHGDERFMPNDRSAWSVVNTRFDGRHSHLTVWDPDRGANVFRSWVTFDERRPDPLYAVASYRHGRITVDYFDAQRRIAELNGHDGLWVAGLYAHDADSHESAIRSAVSIAERLAPGSGRLDALLGS